MTIELSLIIDSQFCAPIGIIRPVRGDMSLIFHKNRTRVG